RRADECRCESKQGPRTRQRMGEVIAQPWRNIVETVLAQQRLTARGEGVDRGTGSAVCGSPALRGTLEISSFFAKPRQPLAKVRVSNDRLSAAHGRLSLVSQQLGDVGNGEVREVQKQLQDSDVALRDLERRIRGSKIDEARACNSWHRQHGTQDRYRCNRALC